MARLLLVRHGQASFHAADYDQLTELGARQSRLLGAWCARRGMVFDRLYRGALRRHRQTWEAFAEGYGEARPPSGSGTCNVGLPEPLVLGELDEYAALELLAKAVPVLAAKDPEVARHAAVIVSREGDVARAKELVFQHITRRWVRGELGLPEVEREVESWGAFRGRIEAAMSRMTEVEERGLTMAAFTSGGVVGAAVGQVLGVDDERTLELSWLVRNASFSQLMFTRGQGGGRVSVLSFNEIPHLDDPELVRFR